MGNDKTIGILTLHRALNYGAIWQCYALKHVCDSFGCKTETIDYNPWGHYTFTNVFLHNPLTAYRYIMQLRYLNQFVTRRLNPTPHTESHEWIKQNPPKDDVYIVGSDTVWANVVAEDYLDSYLLDFAPDNVRRVAYAASTGGNPMELNEYQLGELCKFSAISIRERQSVPDVQSKVDVKVEDVCDPALLLIKEDYESVEEKPLWLPKHYMVYFDLAGDPFCAECAKQMSRELNIPILNLVSKYRRWARYNYMAPTPEQWLYIIHHADYICTNSFHGVAFSIIYRRPFVCCAAQAGERAKTNGRVLNLLAQTNIANRYITSVEEVQKVLEKEIKFDESAIESYRHRSLEWLKNAIDNETDKE